MHITDLIAEDRVSLEEARQGIAGLPATLNDKDAAKLYVALRSWTWKALDQRRRDEELRGWADLIRRARLRVGRASQRYYQLETLAEFLAESVSVAVRLPVSEVLALRHAREILVAIHGRRAHRATKKQLMRALHLEQSNLWRVMNHLSAAGLVECEMHGRERSYVLSRLGMQEVERIMGEGEADGDFEDLVALSDARAAQWAASPSKAGDLANAVEEALVGILDGGMRQDIFGEADWAATIDTFSAAVRDYVPTIKVVAANDALPPVLFSGRGTPADRLEKEREFA